MPDFRRIILIPFLLVLCHSAVAQGQQVPEVSFAADLAPTLAERCSRCHGGNRPRQGLRIESFASLMRGGESGPVIRVNDPRNSLLLQKLTGDADGDRMPPNGNPLSDEWIAKFERWIQSGAKFDGKDRSLDLVRLVSASKLERLSKEDLLADAVQRARKNWALAVPAATPETKATVHFLLVASSGASHLDELAEQIEDVFVKSCKRLGIVKPTLKSPLVIYVLPKRYDFGEFVQMVEKRDTNSQSGTCYWRRDGGLGYGVLGPQRETRESSKSKRSVVDSAQLSRVVTSLLLDRWGAPIWYAEGMGQLAFEKARPRRDARIAVWKKRAPRALTGVKSVKDIFESKLPVGDAEAATWALATFLNRDPKRVRRLHLDLASGTPFDKAFISVFGKAPAVVGDRWLVWLRGGRKK